MGEWKQEAATFWCREYGPLYGVVQQSPNGRWAWRIKTHDCNRHIMPTSGRARFFTASDASLACDAAFLRFQKGRWRYERVD